MNLLAMPESNRTVLLAFAVAAISLLAYSQFFGIQIADYYTVIKIVSHSGTGPGEMLAIFTQPEEYYTTMSENYWPVQSLVLWLLFLSNGMNLVPYHMLNFALHALNAVLVFFLAKKLLRDKNGFFSFFAALLFALHPIQLNAIMLAAKVHEPLMLFFLLASLLLLIKYYEGKKPLFFCLSVFFCALGVFSKSAGILIPVVLFLFALIFSEETGLKKKLACSAKLCIPFFAVNALYFAMMLFSLGQVGGYGFAVSSPKSFLALNFFLYLFFPVGIVEAGFLSQNTGFLADSALDALALVLLIAGTCIALKKLSKGRSNKQALFLAGWLLTYLFAFLAVGIVTPWYVYLPSAAFAILVALFLQHSLQCFRQSTKCKAVFLLLSALAIFLLLFSPLFVSYPLPRMASEVSQRISTETLVAAQRLPAGSTIFLVNYPELLFQSNGLNYPIDLVNEASMQAILDFNLPEKRLKCLSLTASSIQPNAGSAKTKFRTQGNCLFIAKNSDLQGLKMYPSLPSLPERSEAQGISFKQSIDSESEEIELLFPAKEWEKTVLFAFDGNSLQTIEISGFCKPSE